jgi:hypothetical protein
MEFSCLKKYATISPFRITRSIETVTVEDAINWLVDSFLREAKTRNAIRSFIFIFIRYDRVANVYETIQRKTASEKD